MGMMLRRYHDRDASLDVVEQAEQGDLPEIVAAPFEGEGTPEDEQNAEQHDADLAEQSANEAAAKAEGESVESVHEQVEDAPEGTPSAEIPAGPEQPALNASTDAWREYAEARGDFPGDLAEASRTQLVEHYSK